MHQTTNGKLQCRTKWVLGVGRGTIHRRNEKKLAAHKRDEEEYRRYLLAFKKQIPNFISKSPNNSKPFSLVKEAKEIKYNGMAQEE